MRGLFLDFDGVLHPVSAIKDWRDLNIHATDIPELIKKRDLFCWMPILEDILEDHPDVVLIIHSGWRGVANNILIRQILGEKLAQRYIGITSLDLDRHTGIKEFALRSEIKQYIILDDAKHEFPLNHPGLILTSPNIGINDPFVLEEMNRWLELTAPFEDFNNFNSMNCK